MAGFWPLQMIKSYSQLLIASAVVGIISSMMYPVIGSDKAPLRSIILALCLTIGTIVLNYINRYLLESIVKTSLLLSAFIGIVSGCIAGIIISNFKITNSAGTFDGVDISKCMAYGFAFHVGYEHRWHYKHATTAMFITVLLFSYYAGTYEFYLNHLPEIAHISHSHNITGLTRSISDHLLLTTTIPFSIIWILIHMLYDPAFSRKRWLKYVNKSKEI